MMAIDPKWILSITGWGSFVPYGGKGRFAGGMHTETHGFDRENCSCYATFYWAAIISYGDGLLIIDHDVPVIGLLRNPAIRSI